MATFQVYRDPSISSNSLSEGRRHRDLDGEGHSVATSRLPRDSIPHNAPTQTQVPPSRKSSTIHQRRHAISPSQQVQIGENEPALRSLPRKCHNDTRSTITTRGVSQPNGIHEQLLADRVEQARRVQTSWYDAAKWTATRSEQSRLEMLRERREALARAAEGTRQALIRAQDDALAMRLALIAIREEERRRAEEQIQAQRQADIAAREEADQKWREEEERRRRERERECSVCLDNFDMNMMLQVPCSHWYCPEDLQSAMEAALTARNPFQCCNQQVPIELIRNGVTTQFRHNYELLVLETSTRNPVYCHGRDCGLFLPPAQARGPDAMLCSQCGRNTCKHCREWAHPGSDCPQNTETQRAREMAISRGWKVCPACGNMIEKRDGCAHIICRCGAGLCYRCGRSYPCRGPCPPR